MSVRVFSFLGGGARRLLLAAGEDSAPTAPAEWGRPSSGCTFSPLRPHTEKGARGQDFLRNLIPFQSLSLLIPSPWG